jgi:predicted dehydrogenase
MLRIGTLGAARITPMSLLAPSRHVERAEVTTVAARDRDRARAFARKRGIAHVADGYDEMLADPNVDAIYNPLPNGLHCQWTLRALEAGKHVLCEKPFTANAVEAERVRDAAATAGLVVIEAFHWRYHPLAARIRSIIESGQLGAIEHVETWMCVPLPLPGDIRYRYDLAGGATMDVGSYAINLLRTISGMEPICTSAAARLSSPNVDRCMTADFEFPGGATGRIHCSLMSTTLLRIAAHVRGERGELRVTNPVMPHFWHRLRWRADGSTFNERVKGESTYTHQLRAFTDAVLDGAPVLTGPDEAVANMRVIDAVYRKAGLTPRGVDG